MLALPRHLKKLKAFPEMPRHFLKRRISTIVPGIQIQVTDKKRMAFSNKEIKIRYWTESSERKAIQNTFNFFSYVDE
jgi:hypothetical protein